MEREKKADRGELIVEAMMVMLVVVFALFFMMGLAFIVYQQANVNIIANRAASRVAEIYPLVDQDVTTVEISAEDVEDVGLYRYLFGSKSMENKNKEKAEDYAKLALKQSALLLTKGDPTIEAKVVHDGLGRRHIEVTVQATYQVLLLAPLKFFNLLDDSVTYTGTGRAQCVDSIDYINVIGYSKYASDWITKQFPILQALDSVKKLIKTINKLAS